MSFFLSMYGIGPNLAPPRSRQIFQLGGWEMLWTIFIILLVLWLLGLVSGTTLGGFIHVLLVIAIVIVLIRVISGRRPV
jgi:hypothetical protein